MRQIDGWEICALYQLLTDCSLIIDLLLNNQWQSNWFPIDYSLMSSIYGITFLLYSYNSFEAVKTLMEYNADPSLKDADGATPLHFAARHGCVETSKLLLGNSLSSVNCPDNSGITPFHLACASGSLELCELFLEYSADIRARTVEEKNPLHLATLHGNKDIVQLLIKEGWFRRVFSRFLSTLFNWKV